MLHIAIVEDEELLNRTYLWKRGNFPKPVKRIKRTMDTA